MTTAVQHEVSTSARPQLWRVTDRRTFAELRRSSHRSRRGPVTVTWLPATDGGATPPRVAFAIGRTAGGAVARNRIRRRLRSALQDLARRGELPAGAYLIGGRSELATLPWTELVGALGAAVASVAEPDAR